MNGLTALTGKQHSEFIFLAVEKEPPYAVAVYEATHEMLHTAQKQIAPLLDVYAECLKTDVWPGYKDELQQIQLPRWAA